MLISAVALAACGQGGPKAASTPSVTSKAAVAFPNRRLVEGDDDVLREDRKGRDADDVGVLGFGRAATAEENRAVRTLVGSYYAAAARRDGATACALMYSPFAESVPVDYGRPPGPPSLRGPTCAVVMTKFFAQHHRRLSHEERSLRITHVRVSGNQGFAVFDAGRLWGHNLRLHREHGVWKVLALLDSGMP